MQELISQLLRLYLPAGEAVAHALAARLESQGTQALDLVANGAVRALVLHFEHRPRPAQSNPWARLCAVANALQDELGLPAPAVSVSGASGFRLWLSFEEALPVVQAQHFLMLLKARYPDLDLPPDGAGAQVELPPCLHAGSGKWAAFIHPGMGASFVDEPGLDMAPPATAQAAFLEGLHSITRDQLLHALAVLGAGATADAHGDTGDKGVPQAEAGPAADPAPRPGAVPDGLLLRDATLEDIVRFLHAKHIEPTFRHVIPPTTR